VNPHNPLQEKKHKVPVPSTKTRSSRPTSGHHPTQNSQTSLGGSSRLKKSQLSTNELEYISDKTLCIDKYFFNRSLKEKKKRDLLNSNSFTQN